jgi:hypothetical protein
MYPVLSRTATRCLQVDVDHVQPVAEASPPASLRLKIERLFVPLLLTINQELVFVWLDNPARVEPAPDTVPVCQKE